MSELFTLRDEDNVPIRCDCGANVFRKHPRRVDAYACNACGVIVGGDDLSLRGPGLPPGETSERDAVCNALTEAMTFLGELGEAAGERTTVDLRDEGQVRELARLLTVNHPSGCDGRLGANTEKLWQRIGGALASAIPSQESTTE